MSDLPSPEPQAPSPEPQTPSTSLDKVREFHVAFGYPVASTPKIEDWNSHVAAELVCAASHLRMACRVLNRVLSQTIEKPMPLRRAALMIEELRELVIAMAGNDLVACLDGLCDLRYVADGTALELGLAPVFDEAFERVHASNMSKLGGGRDEQGKAMKPDGYVPVQLEDLIKEPGAGRTEVVSVRVQTIEWLNAALTMAEVQACSPAERAVLNAMRDGPSSSLLENEERIPMPLRWACRAELARRKLEEKP